MMAWILSIIFVPFVAVPFYFLVGIRKRESKYHKAYLAFHKPSDNSAYSVDDAHLSIFKPLVNNGIPPASSGHTFDLITDAQEAYRTLLGEIREAKHSIDICTYVFVLDASTEVIYEALLKRAKDGVKVRLLLDTVGSLGIYLHQRSLRALRDAGARVEFFTSLLRRPYLNYISLRNHRKMYIFDQHTVLSGGMNLSDEYMGEQAVSNRYKDLLYRVQGPCVEYFCQIFHSDWVYAVNDEGIKEIPRKHAYEGSEILQVVPSGPDIPSDALYETLLNAIYCAQQRLWIVTPYFVPDENIMQALIIAHRKGIDVKLITPEASDHIFVDFVRMPYIRELDAIGADVLLYNDSVLHAKAILIDDIAAMVGTVNLDNRSLFFNYEVVSFVYSKDAIHSLKIWMETLISASSRSIGKPTKLREAIENIMKVFAPIL